MRIELYMSAALVLALLGLLAGAAWARARDDAADACDEWCGGVLGEQGCECPEGAT